MTRAMAKGEVSRLRAFLTLREQEVRAQSVFRTIRAEREAARESNMSLYGEVAAAMVDDLLELARSWRPDLVVYDPLTYAGPVVAKLLDVPAVRSLFGPDVTYFTNAGEVLGLGRMLDRFGIDSLDLLGAATVDPCPPSLQFPDELVPTRRLRTRYIPYNGISEVPPRLPGRGDRPRVCLTWGTSMVRMLGEQAFLPHDLLFGAAKAVEERDADLVLAIARVNVICSRMCRPTSRSSSRCRCSRCWRAATRWFIRVAPARCSPGCATVCRNSSSPRCPTRRSTRSTWSRRAPVSRCPPRV